MLPRTTKRDPKAGESVFVDASGQRLKFIRMACLITLTGVVAYVGLLGSVFLELPNTMGPLLPVATDVFGGPVADALLLPVAPRTGDSTPASTPAPGTSVPPELASAPGPVNRIPSRP